MTAIDGGVDVRLDVGRSERGVLWKRLRQPTLWLAGWGVLAALTAVFSAALISAGLYDWADWTATVGGTWPDLSVTNGWISLIAPLALGATGGIVLTRYRQQPPPRWVFVAGLAAGVATAIAIAVEVATYGGSFADAVRSAVLPITWVVEGGYDLSGILIASLYQVSTLALLAWITVFGVQAVAYRRPSPRSGTDGASRTIEAPESSIEESVGAHATAAVTGTTRADRANMRFAEAVRIALTTKYADFSGRASRAEFWWFYLFATLVSGALLIPTLLALGNDSSDAALALAIISFWTWVAVGLLLLIPWLAVSVRRLHDIGRNGQSGALLLLQFVPFGSIALLILWAQPTGPDNRYGPGDNELASSAPPVSAPPVLGPPESPPRRTVSSRSVPAGWLPDPNDPSQLRYWDGDDWTESRYRPSE